MITRLLTVSPLAYGESPLSAGAGPVYIFGGIGGSGPARVAGNATDRYNLVDAWTTRTDLPSPSRWGSAAATVDNKAYLIGGYSGGNYLKDNDEYNPDSWTAKTDKPDTTSFGHALHVRASEGSGNGRLYTFGGFNPWNGFMGNTDRYRPSDDSWSAKLDMPVASDDRAQHTATRIYGTIYNIGGWQGANFTTDNFGYRPTGDSWTEYTATDISRRSYCVGVNKDNRIILATGNNSDTPWFRDTVEFHIAGLGYWTVKSDIPVPGRRGSGGAGMNNKVYVMAGDEWGVSAHLQDTEEYISDTWTVKTDCPLPGRYYCAGATINQWTGVLTEVEDDFSDADWSFNFMWTEAFQLGGMSAALYAGDYLGMKSGAGANVNDYWLDGTFRLIDDFDIQIDFDSSNMSLGTDDWSIELHVWNESFTRAARVMQWWNANETFLMFRGWLFEVVGGNYGVVESETALRAGKFRIKRVGTTVTIYIWLGAWVGLTSGVFSTENLIVTTRGHHIEVDTEGPTTTTADLRFDNFSAIAERITFP